MSHKGTFLHNQPGKNIYIHRCFPLSTHNVYSKVAMVTILEVLLWLPVIIRISLKEHPNILHLHDGFTALMIVCSQQITVIGYF